MEESILCLPCVLSFSSALAEPRTDNLYWAPPNFTAGGAQIDGILNFIFWLTLVVFIAVQAVFIFYLVKYRRRKGQPAYYCHGNNVLEIVWTSIPVLIFLGLAIYSNRLWAELHSDPPPDALQVNVSAFQFGWDFRYPGADGKLGSVEVDKISNENKFGVGEADEAGKDDFTSTELVIPLRQADSHHSRIPATSSIRSTSHSSASTRMRSPGARSPGFGFRLSAPATSSLRAASFVGPVTIT